MGYLVAALFFLKFWRNRRDRLFAWFAAAFTILACQRLALGVLNPQNANHFEEDHPGFYVIRLCAFVLILIAIMDKNRR